MTYESQADHDDINHAHLESGRLLHCLCIKFRTANALHSLERKQQNALLEMYTLFRHNEALFANVASVPISNILVCKELGAPIIKTLFGTSRSRKSIDGLGARVVLTTEQTNKFDFLRGITPSLRFN